MSAESGRVHYSQAYSAIEPHLPGTELPWLKRVRRNALDRFVELGFPTPRDEAWKYTRVAPIAKRAYTPPAPDDDAGIELDNYLLKDLQCHRLVFVNGVYSATLSDEDPRIPGLTIASLSSTLMQSPQLLEPHLGKYANPGASGFSALNTAFMGDGAYIRLARNTHLEKPVLLLFVTTTQTRDVFMQPRVLIVGEENCNAIVLEQYVCVDQSSYFNNAITEIVLSAGAHLEHYKLQTESTKAFHIATLQARQDRDSVLQSHSVSLGGQLVRNDINCELNAPGAQCELNGLYMVNGRQHVDYHTRIDHVMPHCVSREFYKGVLDGHARGVFNGRVYVHPDAQKSDAEQVNKNLLLSGDAEIDTKPQLEIFADDVKCSHGATVGQLDEDMLFYLRTRGFTENSARGLLTYGFARDVLDKMSLGPVKDGLREELIAWLPNAQQIREIVT